MPGFRPWLKPGSGPGGGLPASGEQTTRAIVGQAGVEVLRKPSGTSLADQVGQVAVEVIRSWNVNKKGQEKIGIVPAQIGQNCIEVLRQNNAPTAIAGPIPAWIPT